MTDLEITKRCAEAMGLKHEVQRVPDLIQERYEVVVPYHVHGMLSASRYDPLREDAQAMALVKKFRIDIHTHGKRKLKYVAAIATELKDDWLITTAEDENLNRAICECVVEMARWELSPPCASRRTTV